MQKNFLIIGALLGGVSVILGAFAAHWLKTVVTENVLQVYETAVRYQVYHVMALLAVGILFKEFTSKFLLWSGRCFIAGIILFSGSLYVLCLIKHLQIDAEWIGAITPFGGLSFIAGWFFLALGIARKSTPE